MKNKILLLLYIFVLYPNSLLAAQYMLLKVVNVVDGDTIETRINRLPEPLNKVYIRIKGINAPEIPPKSFASTNKLGHAKCLDEALYGLKAKRYMQTLAPKGATMKITNFKWGKYGGRIVADVKINGKNLATEMLSSGNAILYGEKSSWCKVKN